MPEIIPVIVAVIENPEGKFLLLHRAQDKKWAGGLWNIVSGYIEENEMPPEAALREIEEETRLAVMLMKEYPAYDVDYKGKIWRTYAFRFLTNEDAPQLNEEHTEFAWIRIEDISAFEILPIVLEDLKQMGYI